MHFASGLGDILTHKKQKIKKFLHFFAKNVKLNTKSILVNWKTKRLLPISCSISHYDSD